MWKTFATFATLAVCTGITLAILSLPEEEVSPEEPFLVIDVRVPMREIESVADSFQMAFDSRRRIHVTTHDGKIVSGRVYAMKDSILILEATAPAEREEYLTLTKGRE
jgi:hypothetical protein